MGSISQELVRAGVRAPGQAVVLVATVSVPEGSQGSDSGCPWLRYWWSVAVPAKERELCPSARGAGARRLAQERERSWDRD